MEQLIDFHAPEVQAVLDTLLKDRSTGKNIIWATDPPEELQTVMYEPVTDRSQITTQQLGLTHYEVVLPRMMKQTDTQQQRTRKKGEVFSPAWVCNKMNNALDADWFRGLGAEESAGQFTVELPQGWQTVETPVQFPACGGRTPAWVQYVQSRRLEVTCGEAPFLASRYDAATGEMIPVARRIGILDRKLRVVSENAATEDEWRKYATHAVQSTYGYEYQGDNLLLARVNLLLTYAEHLQARWQRKPTKEELQPIANIISWNLWQMDGLHLSVPGGKPQPEAEQLDLFSMLGAAEEQPPTVSCKVKNWRKGSHGTAQNFETIQEGSTSMKFDYVIGIILTPVLMSILSSENAQRVNQSKTYFTLDLLIGWHSTLLRVSRLKCTHGLDTLRRVLYPPAGDSKNVKNGYSTYEDRCYADFSIVG